jgi:hypothetical protein
MLSARLQEVHSVCRLPRLPTAARAERSGDRHGETGATYETAFRRRTDGVAQ